MAYDWLETKKQASRLQQLACEMMRGAQRCHDPGDIEIFLAALTYEAAKDIFREVSDDGRRLEIGWGLVTGNAAATTHVPTYERLYDQVKQRPLDAWPAYLRDAYLNRQTQQHAKAATPSMSTLPTPVDWETLRTLDRLETDYLVEPLLVAGRSHALYAPAKTGKSLLVLEAAVALATGQPFLRQTASQPRAVIYLDYEMTYNDLRTRLDKMGRLDNDLSRLHYYLIPALEPLDTRAGGDQVEQLAKQHQAALVVIDTTSRAIAGEENDADTIRDLYRHTGSRLKDAGIAVLRVDHAGKDITKGQRGTSAKNDDVDIVWQLTGTTDRLSLRCTHQRVGYLPEIVEVQRIQEPHLTHQAVDHQWPAGTADLVDRLDDLGLPTDTGRPKARQAIDEWNSEHPGDQIQATKTQLEAAVKFRKIVRNRPTEDLLGAA